MESAYFKKLKEMIQTSSLSKEDQNALITLFTGGDEAELENLAMLFMENPYWISVINDNYKAKKSALTSGDANIWKEIMHGEENQLNAIGA